MPDHSFVYNKATLTTDAFAAENLIVEQGLTRFSAFSFSLSPMKKNLLTLLVLLFTTSVVFAQTPTTQNPINQIIDGKREGFWRITAALEHLGSPWTPQQTVKEGNYKASMMIGMWTEYFVSGLKKSELTYVNNRPNGPAKTYFENGKLEAEGTWVGTRWTGDYTLYYDNGNVRQKFKYNALGVRDGVQEYYHPNGKLAKTVTVKNGKEEGWEKEYNTNGELITEKFYNGGTIDDKKTIVHEPKKAEDPNAVITPEEKDNRKENSPTVKGTEQKSKEGVFDGEGFWILTNANGDITFKGTFEKNKLIDGEQRFYDSNGKLTRIKKFTGGKYSGDGPLPPEEKAK